MGSSAKKKKEKKKDFQKAKLKVGKTKPKASNFTDTSFKAKSIVLNQQSLSTEAPAATTVFSHNLALLTAKSDTQRRDSLAHLTSAISSLAPGEPLPQPTAVIIPKLQPLILDGSPAVRQQLLKLLQLLPSAEVASHAPQMLLYIRAGMTHLSADIRSASLDVLEWLLRVAQSEVVTCAGGWVKTLRCFLGLLNWHQDSNGTWVSAKVSKTGDSKSVVRLLHALGSLLKVGLGAPPRYFQQVLAEKQAQNFPLVELHQHMLGQKSDPFGYLNLFGPARDEETEMYEDREDRQRVFYERVQASVESGLEQARKEAGEIGRAAGQVRKIMLEGMADFSAQR